MYAVYEFGEYVGTCQSLASFQSYCCWKNPNRQWDIEAINPKNGCKRYYAYRSGPRWQKFSCGRATEDELKQVEMDLNGSPDSTGKLPRFWKKWQV